LPIVRFAFRTKPARVSLYNSSEHAAVGQDYSLQPALYPFRLISDPHRQAIRTVSEFTLAPKQKALMTHRFSSDYGYRYLAHAPYCAV
jgi:hypothetical protein